MAMLPLLDRFSEIAGPKWNAKKSKLLSTKKETNERALFNAAGWLELVVADTALYLGILLGRKATTYAVFVPAVKKFFARLAAFQKTMMCFSVHKRIITINVFLISLFSYLMTFYSFPSKMLEPVVEALRRVITPHNGGAFCYSLALVGEKRGGTTAVLKDLWAFNVSLLAARSTLINFKGDYSTLPHASDLQRMLISEHYDSAALDFLGFAVKTGSDVAYDDFGGTSSAQLYKYLIKVVPKLAPTATHMLHEIMKRRIPGGEVETMVTNLQANLKGMPSKIPVSARHNQFAIFTNSLAFHRRRRHELKLSIEQVDPCHFCGTPSDSLEHVYLECAVVDKARSLYFEAMKVPMHYLRDIRSLTFLALPLPSCSTRTLVTAAVVAFNFACWKVRGFLEASSSTKTAMLVANDPSVNVVADPSVNVVGSEEELRGCSASIDVQAGLAAGVGASSTAETSLASAGSTQLRSDRRRKASGLHDSRRHDGPLTFTCAHLVNRIYDEANRILPCSSHPLMRNPSAPVRLTSFGSAGKRSAEQAAAAVASFHTIYDAIPKDGIIVFTDGSAVPNPGPCGAGVHISFPPVPGCAGGSVTFVCGLGQGSNNIGELWAHGVALQEMQYPAFPLKHYSGVHIFTDSQYSINLITKGHQARANKEITAALKRLYKSVSLTTSLHYHWCAGHTGIVGNDAADTSAGEGSTLSMNGGGLEDYLLTLATLGFDGARTITPNRPNIGPYLDFG